MLEFTWSLKMSQCHLVVSEFMIAQAFYFLKGGIFSTRIASCLRFLPRAMAFRSSVTQRADPNSQDRLLAFEKEAIHVDIAAKAEPRAKPCMPPRGLSKAQSADVCMSPPTYIMRYDAALAHCSPPEEAGERCYFCDNGAVVLQRPFSWCADCAAAVMMENQGSRVMGPIAGKHPLSLYVRLHARLHAHPWERLVTRLLETTPVSCGLKG